MFYDSFSLLNPMEEYVLVTGLNGDLLGEHCLIHGDDVIAVSDNWPQEVCKNESSLGSGKPEGILQGDRNYLCHLSSQKLLNIQRESDGTTLINGERFFVELIGSRKTMVLCGAGHVGLSVLQLANILGFETYVLEDRPLMAEGARKIGADHVLTGSFEENLRSIPDNPENYFVVMTRGHRYDMECLKVILKRESAYAGMMCSRKRIAEARRLMAEEGIDDKTFDKLHAPIGLSIGAETPAEIAVAVMGEIISVMRKRGTNSIPKEILRAIADPRRRVLTQIVSRQGSAPRDAGSRMVVFEDGTIAGTIGGGCFEAEMIRKSRELLALSSGPSLVKVDLSGLSAADMEGVACGGVMEVLLEQLM